MLGSGKITTTPSLKKASEYHETSRRREPKQCSQDASQSAAQLTERPKRCVAKTVEFTYDRTPRSLLVLCSVEKTAAHTETICATLVSTHGARYEVDIFDQLAIHSLQLTGALSHSQMSGRELTCDLSGVLSCHKYTRGCILSPAQLKNEQDRSKRNTALTNRFINLSGVTHSVSYEFTVLSLGESKALTSVSSVFY